MTPGTTAAPKLLAALAARVARWLRRAALGTHLAQLQLARALPAMGQPANLVPALQLDARIAELQLELHLLEINRP